MDQQLDDKTANVAQTSLQRISVKRSSAAVSPRGAAMKQRTKPTSFFAAQNAAPGRRSVPKFSAQDKNGLTIFSKAIRSNLFGGADVT